MAKTYRQSRRRGTSAMAPGSDIPAAVSGFELIYSALPPGSDIADNPGIRGVMTQSGHLSPTHPLDGAMISARSANFSANEQPRDRGVNAAGGN